VKRIIAPSLALALSLCLPLAARAEPPNACGIVSFEALNQIAGGVVTGMQQRKTGNPTECSYVDGRKASVVVIKLQQVQYAAADELQHERETLEKIYRQKVKWVDAVGEKAFWLDANKQLVFLRGHTLGWVTFERKENRNQLDSEQVARLVVAKIQ
jgi:hypothetical protein